MYPAARPIICDIVCDYGGKFWRPAKQIRCNHDRRKLKVLTGTRKAQRVHTNVKVSKHDHIVVNFSRSKMPLVLVERVAANLINIWQTLEITKYGRVISPKIAGVDAAHYRVSLFDRLTRLRTRPKFGKICSWRRIARPKQTSRGYQNQAESIYCNICLIFYIHY